MNVSNTHNCFGCGVCATVCARDVIEIQLNKDGFYEPVFVNSKACTDCGLCVDVCSYQDKKLALPNTYLKSYGAWSRDASVRRKCSSGGVAFELGKFLISKGYKVCAVKYDATRELALHYIASNENELEESIGSKYIQSYTVGAFKAINRKEKYLVIGSPCQIDSFRRYICKFKVEENFVLIDFFCHGVPSMFMWKKYLTEIKEKYNNVYKVVWRDKATGWHDSWSMNIYSTDNKLLLTSLFSKGDAFYRLFLGDGCLGYACYDRCKFKYKNSSADIRIGDAWGTFYKDNELGVNSVVSFTERGDNVLKNSNIELQELPFDIVAESQMKKDPQRIKEYDELMTSLRDFEQPLLNAMKIMDKHDVYVRLMYKINLIIHPFQTFKRISRRISIKNR